MKLVMIIIISQEMDAQIVVNKNPGINAIKMNPPFVKSYAAMV